MSKGGFPFASARFLSVTMQQFEIDILNHLPNKYSSKQELIASIAKVHAELLLIHPFREGNGRTARILANLMSRKAGYGALDFKKIGETQFEEYVLAIQAASNNEYQLMEKLIEFIFLG